MTSSTQRRSRRVGVGSTRGKVPLAFKIAWLALVVIVVPVYALEYGAMNFLWLSNVALLVGCFAAVRESRRLASMMLIAVGLLEIGWIVAFLGALMPGGDLLRPLVAYMFDPRIPLHVRALSLYHFPLPFALFWLVLRLGYDTGAWRMWIPVGWALLVLSYLIATPERSVNWVLGPLAEPQTWMPPLIWLGLLMLASALAWWLTHRIAHALLRRLAQI